MNPPPLLPVHCNLLLFIPHPRGRRHPFQSTTLRTLIPDIFRNVLQRQKDKKKQLSTTEKSVNDVYTFWHKMINLSTFGLFRRRALLPKSTLYCTEKSGERRIARTFISIFPFPSQLLHMRYFTGRKPQDFWHYPVDFHSKLRRLSTGNKH